MASATNNVEEVANKIDKDVLETQRMLQLAAGQKMNTDARRAIFCIIMSSEDYIDAFEKLIRLELPGKQVSLPPSPSFFLFLSQFIDVIQFCDIFFFINVLQDRDVIRVLVECCLQEKVFNKYYTVLASKLCEHDKNHKFTLQVLCFNDKRILLRYEGVIQEERG